MKPLKIAMLTRKFSPHGGLELYTYKLVYELIKLGHNVQVFCLQAEDYQPEDRLTISKLSLPEGRKYKKAERLILESQLFSKELKYLEDNGSIFDIVHSQHFPVVGADVVTFHDHTVFRLSEVGFPWQKAVNEWKCRFQNKYAQRQKFDQSLFEQSICPVFSSATCRDEFVRRYGGNSGKSKSDCVVAYPGSDHIVGLNSEAFKREQESIEKLSELSPNSIKHKTFLFVGRGYRKKGLDILLKAFSKLAKKDNDYKLLIAGLSKKSLDVFRLKALGIDSQVTYMGFVKDMPSLYRQANVIVMPSRVEPFGMAAIQGALFGLVPIVSKVSGASEVFSNGESALFLENQLDANELSLLMEKSCANLNLQSKIAANAQVVARKLTWEETAKSTLEAYQLVLDKNAQTLIDQ